LLSTPGLSNGPTEQYEFVPYTEGHVAIVRDSWLLIGKLDSKGNFEHQWKFPKSSPLSGIPAARIINFRSDKLKVAYEFRSGMLIKGEIDENGSFVPEAGSKVIRFEDYKYGPGSLPIWNLPGYFKKVDKTSKD
jgi:hypothetical protein